jgi:hypothetical protein
MLWTYLHDEVESIVCRNTFCNDDRILILDLQVISIYTGHRSVVVVAHNKLDVVQMHF